MHLSETFTVEEGEIGNRLDRMLAKRYDSLSRSFIQKCIRGGGITVDGQKVKAGYELNGGEKIDVKIKSDFNLGEIPPEDIPLDVVYEDSVLAVINKQPDMIIHPAPGIRTGTLVNALLHRYPVLAEQSDKDDDRPGIIHRLDRHTSGLVIVALDRRYRDALKKQFADRKVKKQYRAIVNGVLRYDSDRIDLPIGRHPREQEKMTVLKKGRNAITEYYVMVRYRNFTEVRLNILTGRTHQIRVHMAHIGHPVAADGVYGHRNKVTYADLGIRDGERDDRAILSRQALHAEKIVFTHPARKELLEFQKDPPDDYQALKKALKDYCTKEK